MDFLKKYSRTEQLLIVLAACTIATFCLWNFSELGVFFVFGDEFGYWSIGAYMNGMDWSDINKTNGYYAYGYGIILGILLAIFKSTELAYRVAVILNVILLLACFFMAIVLIKKIFPEISQKIVILIAFLTICYPTNLVYTRFTWPETILYFYFWVITMLIVSLSYSPKKITLVTLTIVTMLSCITHERTIGIVIAVGLCLLMMAYTKKVSWRYVIFFVIAVLGMYLLHSMIKNEVVINLWQGNVAANANTYMGQILKIKAVFTMEGLWRFVVSLSGKIYYLCISTVMALAWAVLYTCNFCLKSLKSKIIVPEGYIYSFLLLSLAATLAISAIFMIYPNRYDHIIYGRYSESAIGPLFAVGFAALFVKKINLNKVVTGYGLLIIVTFITAIGFNTFDVTGYSMVTGVALLKFMTWHMEPINSLIFLQGVVILLSIIILFGNCSKKDPIKWIVFATVCALIWVPNFLNERMLLTDGYESRAEISILRPYLEKYNSNEDIDYLFMEGNNNLLDLACLQYFMPDTKFKWYSIENPGEILGMNKQKCIIVYTEKNEIWDLLNDYELVKRVRNNYLLVPTYSEVANKMREDGISFMSENGQIIYDITNGMHSQNMKDNTDEWISNGQAGYVAYGPYITLEAGDYCFTIEYENLQSLSSEAVLDIAIEGESVKQKKLPLKALGSTVQETLNLSLNDTAEHIEMRLWVPENSVVRVKYIKIGCAK